MPTTRAIRIIRVIRVIRVIRARKQLGDRKATPIRTQYGPPVDPLWTPYGPSMDPNCEILLG